MKTQTEELLETATNNLHAADLSGANHDARQSYATTSIAASLILLNIVMQDVVQELKKLNEQSNSL